MKISNREWAQLSAYLDGELSQRELIKLQNRMEEDPDLNAALEEIRYVKSVLTHTPLLSVPRNFKLTSAMVEVPHRRSQAWGYRLAAAALSFLFIGVVVLDIGSGVLKSGMLGAEAPRAEEVMLEAAADELEEPAVLAVEKAAEEEVAPAAEMEEAVKAPEKFDSGQEGDSVRMAEGETETILEETNRDYSGGEDAWEEESQELENGLSLDEEPMPTEADYYPEQEISRPVETLAIPWMRILEIALGLGAIGLWGAAWIKRQKNRK
ncbi:MAG: hypothetical protein DRI65_10835 [Chloroflexota bacterium]|nr:MAG: hypothetical protein DRI65_10835 [Chloroflexota bacterium]